MVLDIFTFNGELDLLEIRLNILNDFVDQFIIIEACTTFSGKPKKLYFEENKERYSKWNSKIKYHVIDENYTQEEIKQAEESPNTQGAEHWKREFLQKESIKKAITHLNDDDFCFIGDVDEIWNPEYITYFKTVDGVEKMKLSVHTYFLNNYSSEEFWGTIYGKYKDIKNECLNHLRVNAKKTLGRFGWHFTSMGGYEEVKRKLSDSYTRQSYWTSYVETFLEDNIKYNRDFLGRDFKYYITDLDLPQYLLDNKEKYKHLWKQ